MRDLTKSLFSFSWAMSLFGVQQAVNMLSPSKAARAFDNVTGATREQFCDVTKAIFRAGDNMQRGMVDMMCASPTGRVFDPSRWTRMTADVMEQSAAAAGRGMREDGSAARQKPQGAPQQSGAWGPAQDSESREYSRRQEQQDWGPAYDAGCDPCGRRG